MNQMNKMSSAERAGLAKAVAQMLDEAQVATDLALASIRVDTVAAARQQVQNDVKAMAELSVAMHTARREALLADLDAFADRVRGFSAPVEMTGASWLREADINQDVVGEAASLLPDSWGDVCD